MILNVHYMISLALIFVLLSTGSWKKSYSTTAFLFAVTISMYYSRDCGIGINYGHLVVNIVSIVMVFRTLVHKYTDKLIRR